MGNVGKAQSGTYTLAQEKVSLHDAKQLGRQGKIFFRTILV